jgi:uncharacterized phage protein (TIGR02220 family)
MNKKEVYRTQRLELARQVISYLNENADKKYTLDSPGIIKLFTAEWGEKYGFAQYKGVIDYLILTWKNNPTMEKFLRPKTLFGKENFPMYLDEARSNYIKERDKRRLNPFKNYIPVESSESTRLISFEKYDPNI